MELIRQDRTCRILPTQGQPFLPDDVRLPEDLREFYQLCGGVYLYEPKSYGIKIVEPYEIRRANRIIAGADGEDDVSWSGC